MVLWICKFLIKGEYSLVYFILFTLIGLSRRKSDEIHGSMIQEDIPKCI